ncbi:MAG: hypothetical protein V3T86_05230 [Planctomycetota bacterium]
MLRTAWFLVCVFAALAGAVAADERVLKNGSRISCEVVEVTETSVRVRLPNGTMVFRRDRVEEIVREAAARYLKREGERSLRRGSTAGAVELLEKAYRAGKDPASRAALLDALGRHANAMTLDHRYEEATAAARRMQVIDPRNAIALAVLERIAKEEAKTKRLLKDAADALEAGDAHAGLAALNRWRLRRAPGDPEAKRFMAEGHLLAAERALEDGELRLALDHLRAVASYGAGERVEEALFLLAPVAVLEAMGEGDLDEAERRIGAIPAYPDRAVPVFLRAVLRHLRGELNEATDLYAKAARTSERNSKPARGIDYESVRVLAARTLSHAVTRPSREGADNWRTTYLDPLHEHASAHFVVYAPTRQLAERAADVAEQAYAAATRELLGGSTTAPKAEVVVHGNRAAYLEAALQPNGAPEKSIVAARDQTAGLCYEVRDSDGGKVVRVESHVGVSGLFADTLPHEIAHVVQRQGFRAYRAGHWLDEGVATTFESERARAARRNTLKAEADAIPLREFVALRSTPPDKMPLFYAQAHSLTEFLMNRSGRAAWRTFLDVYAKINFKVAIKHAYGYRSIEDLERDWLYWLAN